MLYRVKSLIAGPGPNRSPDGSLRVPVGARYRRGYQLAPQVHIR